MTHRRYLNGPGRPPISVFGFVSAALRCSSTHVRSLRLRRSLARGEGRRPPCTPSSVLDFVHSGSAPVLAKASPKPELDGRRLRLRYRGWAGRTVVACLARLAALSLLVRLKRFRPAVATAGEGADQAQRSKGDCVLDRKSVV